MAGCVALTTGLCPERARGYGAALEAAGVKWRVLSCSDQAILPPCSPERLLRGLDGLLLTGGGDIDPSLQGAGIGRHASVSDVHPDRDELERGLLGKALEMGLPVLAICRGMQVLNWTLGGTLFADIDDFVAPAGLPKGHRQTDQGRPRDEIAHPITIAPGSRLAAIMGVGSVGVNSIHHQALDRLAPGLRATAFAPDGVVEAVELEGTSFVVGVQFHPEDLWRHHAPVRRLFEAFALAVHQTRTERAP